jgi:hypothetical protein
MEKQGVIRPGKTPSEDPLPTPDKVKKTPQANERRREQNDEYSRRKDEFNMGPTH